MDRRKASRSNGLRAARERRPARPIPLDQVCGFMRAVGLSAQLAKLGGSPVNVATIEVYLPLAARAHPAPRESGLLRGNVRTASIGVNETPMRMRFGAQQDGGGLSPELIHT